MTKRFKSACRSGIPAAALYAGAVALVAVPSASLALGAFGSDSEGASALSSLANFTPASIDSRLARLVAQRSGAKGQLMRFTPSGAANRPDRSVTVAVRVDDESPLAISNRTALAATKDTVASGSTFGIASMRYDLGMKRGYQSFAKPQPIAKDLIDAPIPNLEAFQPSPGVKSKPSRFNARIAIEEEKAVHSNSLDSLGDQTFDLGGSYRVTRNLDVTAGVRYSQERDRLAPLTNGKQDSQAVYVGTQFRF